MASAWLRRWLRKAGPAGPARASGSVAQLAQVARAEYAVLFCCTANICRSPTAEQMFRAAAEAAGVASRLRIDSAGTHDYQLGQPPDPRARHHAQLRGLDLGGLRARRVTRQDFDEFDLIVAMDDDNLQALHFACPEESRHKLRLAMSFAPRAGSRVVPDPYVGGPEAFERVLDLLELACAGVLGHVQAELLLRRRQPAAPA